MSRYTGPRAKVCRRLGFLAFENANVEKAFLKRETQERFGRKRSEYGRRLVEKQKVMYYYGMREKQMRIFFDRARRQHGDTGRNFLSLCERRLDNAVFSAGFASSRNAARQMINHGHVALNGRKTDVASALVGVGDTITVRDRDASRKLAKSYMDQRQGYEAPEWIATDPKSFTAKIVRLPAREDARLPVNEQLVVEFYSR